LLYNITPTLVYKSSSSDELNCHSLIGSIVIIKIKQLRL
jgi:hypothetical protein